MAVHESLLQSIERAEQRLIGGFEHIEELPKLIDYVNTPHATACATACRACYNVLSSYVRRLEATRGSPAAEKATSFLLAQVAELQSKLLKRLWKSDDPAHVELVNTYMQALCLVLRLNTNKKETQTLLYQALEALFQNVLDGHVDREDTLNHIVERYMTQYDVQFAFLRVLQRGSLSARGKPKAKRAKAQTGSEASDAPSENTIMVTNMYMVLHQFEPLSDGQLLLRVSFLDAFDAERQELRLPEEGEDMDELNGDEEGEEFSQEAIDAAAQKILASLGANPEAPRAAPAVEYDDATQQSIKQLKKAFTDAWVRFLQFKLPSDIFRDVLSRLADSVMPHMTNPKLLLDFLTHVYDQGGVPAALSLDALFILMYQYNLDYPRFYHQLYRLLDGPAMYARHRGTLLPLIDKFLSSTHLPLYMAACFAKRLARLALMAPPSAGAALAQLVYNLIKRHPKLRILAHRDLQSDGEGVQMDGDPFDMDAELSAEAHGTESSLWELEMLQEHYLPEIQDAMALLKTPAYRKPPGPVDKMAGKTYTTTIKAAMRHAVPEDVATTFVEPESLVPATLHDLWTAAPLQ